jgi:membrane-associated PAP2 superfamily phosphatase
VAVRAPLDNRAPGGDAPGVRKRSWRCAVRALSTLLVLLVIGALLVYTLRRRR